MDIMEPEIEKVEESAKTSLGKIVAWIALIALLTVVAFGLKKAQKGRVTIDDVAPTFTVTTFDGQTLNSEDFVGKVVVLNFWASWCKPCEQEAAELETVWRLLEPRGDVIFLGIDYVDTEPEALAYLDKFNITFPNAPDKGTKISQAFNIRGVPETYVIDQNGVVFALKIGPYLSESEILSMITPLFDQ